MRLQPIYMWECGFMMFYIVKSKLRFSFVWSITCLENSIFWLPRSHLCGLNESIMELVDWPGGLWCNQSKVVLARRCLRERERSREGQETTSRQLVCGLCLSVDLKLLHQHASTGKELSQPGDKIKDKALKGKMMLKRKTIKCLICKLKPLHSFLTRLFSTRGRKKKYMKFLSEKR